MTLVPVLVAELLCPSSEYWYGYCRGSSDPGKYCNKKKEEEVMMKTFIPACPNVTPNPHLSPKAHCILKVSCCGLAKQQSRNEISQHVLVSIV